LKGLERSDNLPFMDDVAASLRHHCNPRGIVESNSPFTLQWTHSLLIYMPKYDFESLLDHYFMPML
jgi:hypothetical protein